MDDDEGCGGLWAVDVTVGEASITLQSHTILTPELLDTYLARMTRQAAAGEYLRCLGMETIVRAREED